MYERVMRALTITGGLALAVLFALYGLMAVSLSEGMAGEAGTIGPAAENAMFAVIDEILWPARLLQLLVPPSRSLPTAGAALALISSLAWGVLLYGLGRLVRAIVVWWSPRPVVR